MNPLITKLSASTLMKQPWRGLADSDWLDRHADLQAGIEGYISEWMERNMVSTDHQRIAAE